MESLGAYVDYCVSRGHICLVPMYFLTAVLLLDGISPGEGWDTVT